MPKLNHNARHPSRIAGIGVNDHTGVASKDPKYQKWCSMLNRCYNQNLQVHYPSYTGCTTVPEWHLFSNFDAWIIKQDWVGMHLDKDILVRGNKVYGPATCLMIPPEINRMMSHHRPKGVYPKGVSLHKPSGKYQASISIEGKFKYIGLYDTINQAESAYMEAKTIRLWDVARGVRDSYLRAALLRHTFY